MCDGISLWMPQGIARLTGGTAPSVEACEATAKACFEASSATAAAAEHVAQR
jgi:hypothetical protein